MTWKVEHRPQVKRVGKIKLRDISALKDCFGFRSVYAFDDETCEHIIGTNSSRGLHGSILYSEQLFLDFDDQPQMAAQFEYMLITSDISYEKYTSGNRSVHFHIPFKEPMIGPNISQIQRKWVESNAPGADLSFYNPAGMYRLEGTYHIKNPGHKKELLCLHKGSVFLTIKEKEYKPTTRFKSINDSNYEEGELYSMLTHLITNTVHEGGRNYHAWKIVKTHKKLNKDIDTAYQNLMYWNEFKCDPPLTEDKLSQTLREVYES